MYIPKKDDPCYYTLYTMQVNHLYPTKSNVTKRYYIISAFLRLFGSVMVVDSLLHIIMGLKDGQPVDMRDLVVLSGVLNSVFICLSFEVNQQRFSKFYVDLADTTKFGVPPSYSSTINNSKRWFIINCIYDAFAFIMYPMISWTIGAEKCRKTNIEKEMHEVCGTVMPVWRPYQVGTLELVLININQLFTLENLIVTSALILFGSWDAASLIVCKIHHLKGLFLDAFNTEDHALRRNRLKFCIRYHQEILRLCVELNEVNKLVSGQLAIIGALTISVMGVQIIKDYSIAAVIHLIGTCLAWYWIFETGQIIRDETYNIQDAVYESQWYKVDPKLAKDIQLVILRCQKPILIEALPIGSYDYSLMILILKTSYSYLTLIYNVVQE